MCVGSISNSEISCEELHSKLNFLEKKDFWNKMIIDDQQKVIANRDIEISQLKERHNSEASRHQESFRRLNNFNKTLMITVNTLLRQTELLNQLRISVDTQVKLLQENNDCLNSEIEALRASVQLMTLCSPTSKSESFPKDLLDKCDALKSNPEPSEPLDDMVFYHEMARRITCKICHIDVERLRCSQCLKGVCLGCHSRVQSSEETGKKKCAHCRSEEPFERIMMSRI